MIRSPLKLTPRLEERINARWLIWHPWCLVLAKKRLPFVDTARTLEQCRTIHRERYLEILKLMASRPLNHREQHIRNTSLDDPRLSMEEFRIKLEDFMRYRTGQLRRYSRQKEKQVANSV